MDDFTAGILTLTRRHDLFLQRPCFSRRYILISRYFMSRDPAEPFGPLERTGSPGAESKQAWTTYRQPWPVTAPGSCSVSSWPAAPACRCPLLPSCLPPAFSQVRGGSRLPRSSPALCSHSLRPICSGTSSAAGG